MAAPRRKRKPQGPRLSREPLTRADLERIAEERGIRIDDLWPEIEARATQNEQTT